MFKDVTIVSKWGEVLQIFKHASSASIEANANPNGFIVPGLPPLEGSLWDFSLERFVLIEEMPTVNHKFNYESKSWEDTRSILEVKDDVYKELKVRKLVIESQGVEFQGSVFDCDETALTRMALLISLGEGCYWTLKDNSSKWLTIDELKSLYSICAKHIADTHIKFQNLRDQINNTEDLDQILSLSKSIQEIV